MTEETLWTSLEACYRNSDWTGVAVLADRFEELDQPELADTVRWLSRVEPSGKCILFWSSNLGHWCQNSLFSNLGSKAWGNFSSALVSAHSHRNRMLKDLL